MYHDDRAISVNWSYINGYPIFVMPLDEARKYRRILIKTTGWNNDDPVGIVGITILLDDDYFDWHVFSGIPTKEWGLDFNVCGVSGGCSKAWLWVRVKPEG
ncbi:hypothetical protein [Thermococcus sp. GR6]|uniref:hypothetical protein n=1 Tax=Thermococcus sp. GR6 TaxID=1638256 RepID=UPI001F0F7D96|nr:hypothetical protein [Thermococcus sp. GR6]